MLFLAYSLTDMTPSSPWPGRGITGERGDSGDKGEEGERDESSEAEVAELLERSTSQWPGPPPLLSLASSELSDMSAMMPLSEKHKQAQYWCLWRVLI